MQVSALTAIFKADFGRFRPFLACSGRIGRRPIRPDMADTARFWPNQPDSSANRSRFGTNRAASARIELSRRESEKKKPRRGPTRRQPRRTPRRAASDAGAAPLVPRPCFLAQY